LSDSAIVIQYLSEKNRVNSQPRWQQGCFGDPGSHI